MSNQVKIIPSKGPFWRWNLNFAVGKCPGDCLYCYNKRWPWAHQDFRVKDDLIKLDSQCGIFQWKPGGCKQYNGQWDIMMSSSHDPLCPAVQDIADKILIGISDYPEVLNHLRVLSKFWGQGFLVHDLPSGPLYGATITTLDNDVSRQLQPNATIPSWEGKHVRTTNLLDVLACVHGFVGNIWVSSEPMFQGMNLYNAADYLENWGGLPIEWWVGRLNHENTVPEICREAALPDVEIIRQFGEAIESFPGINWHLKAEVTE